MAIPGQANINIGAENQVAGSDTLFEAFHTIQNNFTQLFETSSPFDTFRAGEGVTVTSNVSNGVVSITNTGVTKITAGSGISISGAAGNVTISSIPLGPLGVTRVGLTSSTLNVTGGNIVSQGNFTVDLPRIQTGEHFATGEYIAPTLTVDGFGRITSIANGVGVGTVTSVGLTPGKGISVTGGPIIDSGAITVENTGVTSVQAGKGIQVTSANGDITISATNDGAGSVAYVGLTSNNLTITGGPVTSVGNFTVDLPSSFVSNLYSNAIAANYIPTYTGNLNPNNIAASSNITANGNITANNITATNVLHANVVSANTFTGTFSGNATTAGTVTTNAQPNITSVGNLTSLVVTGAANVGANLNVTGNVIISGNTTSYIANSTYGAVQSGFEIGSDGYILFRAINGSGNYVAFVPPTSVSVAGLSWQLPNTIGNASQVLVSDGGPLYWRSPPAAGTNSQVQFNDVGNANGSTSLTFNKTTGTLSVGNLNVTGNATSTNVFATTQMTAPRFISNVAVGTAPFTVTSTTQVANLNAALAGTVVTNAQPNITSTGTLTGLTVSGNASFTGANVSLGAVGNVKVTGGTSGQFLRTDGLGNLSWVTASGFDGSQAITISNTTVATSVSSGALKVSGGVGVTGNVYAGNLVSTGTLYTESTITANSSISAKGISSQGTIYATGNVSSDSYVDGQYVKASSALYVYGKSHFGPAANVEITGGASGQVLTTDGAGNLSWTTVSGGGGSFDGSQIINISNTTASTSKTTGALKVSGGVGIAGNINVGGAISSEGNISATFHQGTTTSDVSYSTYSNSYINTSGEWLLSGVYFDSQNMIINKRYWSDMLGFQQLLSSISNGSTFYVDPGGWGGLPVMATSNWGELTMYGPGIWQIKVSFTSVNPGATKLDTISINGVTLVEGGSVKTATIEADAIKTSSLGFVDTSSIRTTNNMIGFSTFDMMFGVNRKTYFGGYGGTTLMLDDGNLAVSSTGYITKNNGNISFMAQIQTGDDIVSVSRGAISARCTVTNATTYSDLSLGTLVPGSRAFITDSTVAANSTTFGQVISSGGGSYKVPVWYDGSNWRIG